MAKQKVEYSEDAIKTLDALSHIRLRTGMYIGRIGDGTNPSDGIYVLLKEIVDNSIDEFIMGAGKRVEITRTGNTITIRDYGRGIPLGKVIDCVSQINTGGKYNDDVFQFSVGLNGVGTKAVNALSGSFEVKSFREGQFKRARFAQGKLVDQEDGKAKDQPNGTWVEFTPDSEIFKKYAWHDEFIAKRLQYYCYLNAGLTHRLQRHHLRLEERPARTCSPARSARRRCTTTSSTTAATSSSSPSPTPAPTARPTSAS